MKPLRLTESLEFDAPVYDDRGSQTGIDEGAYACRARFRFLRGGEAVQAARLDGKQPVVATIRRSSVAETITPDWVMRDVRTNTAYNVRSVVPTDDRKWLEITAESGAAT